MPCWDLVVPLIGVCVVRGYRRIGLAVATVVLFAASFPPLNWPTWWFCLAPMIPLWRWCDDQQPLQRTALEAGAIGFAMGWLATGFIHHASPALGWLFHGIGCLLFSCQTVVFGIAIQQLRNVSILRGAILLGGLAMLAEFIHAYTTPVWWLATFSLPAAATPVMQWAEWITPVGVSAIVHGVNFLAVVDRDAVTRLSRWTAPTVGLAIVLLMWTGGLVLSARTPVEPLPFSVMLVQPGIRADDGPIWPRLDRLTSENLEALGSVDLIVWPETCLNPGFPGQSQHSELSPLTGCTIADFATHLQPAYSVPCLVGAPVLQPSTKQQFGLTVQTTIRKNCGCIVSEGSLDCHEKIALVPLMEGVPEWLDGSFIRSQVLPAADMKAPFTVGKPFQLRRFQDQDGNIRTVAISICYEAHGPFLLQYSDKFRPDAIIHIANDGHFMGHLEFTERQILACRSRAMETRTWNLLCSTMDGSIIVDPRGRVTARLGRGPGVLRSDSGTLLPSLALFPTEK